MPDLEKKVNLTLLIAGLVVGVIFILFGICILKIPSQTIYPYFEDIDFDKLHHSQFDILNKYLLVIKDLEEINEELAMIVHDLEQLELKGNLADSSSVYLDKFELALGKERLAVLQGKANFEIDSSLEKVRLVQTLAVRSVFLGSILLILSGIIICGYCIGKNYEFLLANPQPTNPQFINPQFINPQPTNPQPTNPQPTNPQDENPQDENPQDENPQDENPQDENANDSE